MATERLMTDAGGNEGDLRGARPAFMLHTEPKNRPSRSQRVHRSDEGPVMGVEQRDPGRWNAEET